MATELLHVGERIAPFLLSQPDEGVCACNWLDDYISDTNDLTLALATCATNFDANLTVELEQGCSPMLRQSLQI